MASYIRLYLSNIYADKTTLLTLLTVSPKEIIAYQGCKYGGKKLQNKDGVPRVTVTLAFAQRGESVGKFGISSAQMCLPSSTPSQHFIIHYVQIQKV